jgi:hypothetical protein
MNSYLLDKYQLHGVSSNFFEKLKIFDEGIYAKSDDAVKKLASFNFANFKFIFN